MNFETVTLGDLVKHKKGFAFKTKDYCETGIPVIKVSNFTNNSIEDIDLQYVPQAIANQNKSVELKENDIVIATVGSWASNPNSVVGKTIRVPSWANGSLMNQNAVILRSKNDSLVDQLFIFYYMKQQSFKDLIVSRS
jgi:type I restriction enzyme S subunit